MTLCSIKFLEIKLLAKGHVQFDNFTQYAAGWPLTRAVTIHVLLWGVCAPCEDLLL